MPKIIFLHGFVGSKNNFEFLEKEFSDYQTLSFDLIGFGSADKPDIDYSLSDYLIFLEQKLNLIDNTEDEYILVGHSLGALLSKELAKKYPRQIKQIFLMGYPFLDRKKALGNRMYFDGFYVDGVWWAKIICEIRSVFEILFLPFIYLFGYKYRKSWLAYFHHTYRSAFGTIHNTIFKDDKGDIYQLSDKIIFINGQNDGSADIEFASNFKQYIIQSMGHRFFNFESEIARIIKYEIGYKQ